MGFKEFSQQQISRDSTACSRCTDACCGCFLVLWVGACFQGIADACCTGCLDCNCLGTLFN